METFHRPEGRLMMTMGNGSTPDWKLENLEAMYEESMRFNERLESVTGLFPAACFDQNFTGRSEAGANTPQLAAGKFIQQKGAFPAACRATKQEKRETGADTLQSCCGSSIIGTKFSKIKFQIKE